MDTISPVNQPNQKGNRSVLKYIFVILIIIIFMAGSFVGGIYASGIIAKNSLVIDPGPDQELLNNQTVNTQEEDLTDPQTVTTKDNTSTQPQTEATLPSGFKKISSNLCKFSTVIPESVNYKEADYYWKLTENSSQKVAGNFVPMEQTIVGLERRDSLGSGYVAGWVVVDCKSSNGMSLNQAFDDLESEVNQLNEVNGTNEWRITKQGYIKVFGQDAIIYTTAGGYSDRAYILFVKNNLVYKVSTIVMSTEESIQKDVATVWSYLSF